MCVEGAQETLQDGLFVCGKQSRFEGVGGVF